MMKPPEPDVVAWHPPEINEDLPLGAYKTDDGDLVVWVDASPDDVGENSGWFEPYEGKAADYRAQRPASPDEDGYVDDAAARQGHKEHRARNIENVKRVHAELDEAAVEARSLLSGDALELRLEQIEKARP